ncbi:MAG TPA: hypothetical protein PLZ32_14650 [Saprospiraceae bacterium]|nr:hypothetical protein [Saprospiraceae bacterium]
MSLYVIFSFLVIPVIAKPLGRVRLPIFEDRHLKPANIWTAILNRNYVKPNLQTITYKVAEQMHKNYPGVTINYLDANFPFLDQFPLLPHLSHHDGKKLDLSFQYNDSQTGKMIADVPSLIGYGICEEARAGEVNKSLECKQKGYWQYNLLRDILWQGKKDKFIFDNQKTKDLINGFASDVAIDKIFLEPHLKTRLGLTNDKIRFHGCQAVRHDDHIHVQIK